MTPVGIKLIGPIYDVSGIAQCVREAAIALHDSGINVQLIEIRDFAPFSPDIEEEKINKLRIMQSNQQLGKNFVTVHYYPLELMARTPLDPQARANITWNVYETDRIPYFWKLLLNKKSIDQAWVASEFNKETFINSKVDRDKVQVVNQGVDLITYNPNNKPLDQFPKTDKSFYFSYISELKVCKGYDLLLKAFYEEFANEPTAKLIFKCTSTDDRNVLDNIVNMIKSYKGSSKAEIILLHGNKSEDFMKRLYASADCFVLPTRGEGWGLGLIQSMASGIPVITTKCTAQMTYCNEENSLLIDANPEKIHNLEWLMSVPIQNEHWWWEPNYNQLKQKMRYAFEHRDVMKAKGIQARKDVEKFSWANTVIQIIKNLKRYE